MRTTIALDDELVATAQAYTGLTEKSALVREALTALVQREAARRLALLGGSQPNLKTDPTSPSSKMILVDTSIWVDHLRKGDLGMQRLLDQANVLCHPWIVGELAMGELHPREAILRMLRQFPIATIAEPRGVLHIRLA